MRGKRGHDLQGPCLASSLCSPLAYVASVRVLKKISSGAAAATTQRVRVITVQGRVDKRTDGTLTVEAGVCLVFLLERRKETCVETIALECSHKTKI